MNKFLFIVCITFPFSINATPLELKTFVSDGCSFFPDGNSENNTLWLHCCRAHDLDYWQGGTKQQRLASDARLKNCVEQTGESTVASMMFSGVRLGGSPYLPTPFRWGFGWSYPRSYGHLTKEEMSAVIEKLSPQQSVSIKNTHQ